MGYQFIWHTGGEKPCYACSRWEGEIFATANDLPDLPVHPNCECFVEAFDPNIKLLTTLAERIKKRSSTCPRKCNLP